MQLQFQWPEYKLHFGADAQLKVLAMLRFGGLNFPYTFVCLVTVKGSPSELGVQLELELQLGLRIQTQHIRLQMHTDRCFYQVVRLRELSFIRHNGGNDLRHRIAAIELNFFRIRSANCDIWEDEHHLLPVSSRLEHPHLPL